MYGAKGEELKADTPFGNMMKVFTDNQHAIDLANMGDLAFTGYSSYQGFVNAGSNSILGHGMLANFADDAVSSTGVSGGIVDAWTKFVNWVKGDD